MAKHMQRIGGDVQEMKAVLQRLLRMSSSASPQQGSPPPRPPEQHALRGRTKAKLSSPSRDHSGERIACRTGSK
jgi:hypothetical protein